MARRVTATQAKTFITHLGRSKTILGRMHAFLAAMTTDPPAADQQMLCALRDAINKTMCELEVAETAANHMLNTIEGRNALRTRP